MPPLVLLMKRTPNAVGGVAKEVVLLQVLLTKRTPNAVGGVAKEVVLLQVLLMKRTPNVVGGVAKEVVLPQVLLMSMKMPGSHWCYKDDRGNVGLLLVLSV